MEIFNLALQQQIQPLSQISVQHSFGYLRTNNATSLHKVPLQT